MRPFSLTGLCVLLSGTPQYGSAMEPEQAAVENLLRANGLVPRSRLSRNPEKSSIVVRGTERKPEFVVSSCGAETPEPTTLRGKRFTYEADNRGEFGGELNVREGGGAARPIVRGNVHALRAIENDLYVFTGLDHLGMSSGSVDLIEDYDSHPRSRHLTDLPEAPQLVVQDRNWDGFLVVSTLSISVIQRHGNLDIIMARHAYLPRPNSVLSVGPADILVGVCGGVAWVHAPWRMNRPPDPTDGIPLVTYWTRQ